MVGGGGTSYSTVGGWMVEKVQKKGSKLLCLLCIYEDINFTIKL
jgi:hypothetical protein